MKEIITSHVSSRLTTILIAKPEQKLFTVFCQGFIDFSITHDQLLQGHTTKKAEITSWVEFVLLEIADRLFQARSTTSVTKTDFNI